MIKLFAKLYDKYVTKLDTMDEIWLPRRGKLRPLLVAKQLLAKKLFAT